MDEEFASLFPVTGVGVKGAGPSSMQGAVRALATRAGLRMHVTHAEEKSDGVGLYTARPLKQGLTETEFECTSGESAHRLAHTFRAWLQKLPRHMTRPT